MPERDQDRPDAERETQEELREEGDAVPRDRQTEREADVQAAADDRPAAPGTQTDR